MANQPRGRANRQSGCRIPRPNEQEQWRPDVVRIGPYYNDLIHQMEREKKDMLFEVLPSDGVEQRNTMKRLMEDISVIEKEARDHYADRANRMRSSAHFVKMLMLDGCYIVGMFVLPRCHCPRHSAGGASGAGSHSGEVASSQSGDAVSSQSTGAATTQSKSAMEDIALVRDVFYLIHNQIPFCVLDTIHKVLHGPNCSDTAVAEALSTQLEEHLGKLFYSKVQVDNPRPWHLLHLLHMHFPRPENHTTTSTRINNADHAGGGSPNGDAAVYRWRTATKYHEAGVWFKKQPLDGASGTLSILDVKLIDGQTLCIPSLTVDNNTCRILRNLMALEQLNPEELGSHITAYCLFMSQIACTANDVELLVKKGIIVHALRTDSDVADRLAGLCSVITIDHDEIKHNYLYRTRWDLERLYSSRRIKWMTLLRRNHFANPLLVIALFFTFLAFASGIFQSVYTVLAYYYSSRR